VSIGFAVGLPFTYLLALIALATLAWWLARRLPRPPWPLIAADLAGGALFCAVTAFMGAPYLTLARTQADAVRQARNLTWVQLFSPSWRQLLEPPDLSGTWNWLAGSHPGGSEQLVLPGYALITLAAVGLFHSAWRLRWRVAVAAGTAVFTDLTLGTHVPGFVFLWQHAPGWAADRTPGRLVMFVTLGLAVLAAGAVTRLTGQLAPDGPRSRAGTLRLAAAAVLPLLVLAEGYSRVPEGTVPPVPAAMRHAPWPLIVAPSVIAVYMYSDSTVMAWSAMTGFPPIGNGGGGITPDSFVYMRRSMSHFPDRASVAYLRSHHFRSVVVVKDHTVVPLGDLPEPQRIDPGKIPAPSLGLRRIDMGDSVLYLVEPANPPGAAWWRLNSHKAV
jgi:hypothetical protein